MNSTVKGILIVVAVIGGLTLLRTRPWERPAGETAPVASSGSGAAPTADARRERLKVGFLPVT